MPNTATTLIPTRALVCWSARKTAPTPTTMPPTVPATRRYARVRTPPRVVVPAKMTNALMTAQYQRLAEMASPTTAAVDAAIIACTASRLVGAHPRHGVQRGWGTRRSRRGAAASTPVHAWALDGSGAPSGSVGVPRVCSAWRNRACASVLRATRCSRTPSPRGRSREESVRVAHALAAWTRALEGCGSSTASRCARAVGTARSLVPARRSTARASSSHVSSVQTRASSTRRASDRSLQPTWRDVE